MQLSDCKILYSATDLNDFLACAYLTTLDLRAVRNGTPRPTRLDDETAILARLGDAHEQRYMELLRGQGRDIAEIDRRAPLKDAVAATTEAMSLGRDIIYQAAFLDGDWMGRADFLRKVPNSPGTANARWAWLYEVEDAKLARRTEPNFLLQLCYYSEHVAQMQGTDPENMYVILGDGAVQAFRYSEFAAYYRQVKREFLKSVESGGARYPLPVEHCQLCVWHEHCDTRWKADDHLSLVAGTTTLQTTRLTEACIVTLAQLAVALSDSRPERMERTTFDKLHRQARQQLAQREADVAGAGPVPPEFLPHSAEEWRKKGFALLPQPSPYDVFFDMEGDPYYDLEASLEYLFGAYTNDDGEFRSFWGCDRSAPPGCDRLAEKIAFEQFIDFIVERYRQHPEMRVYHYAAYEKTKLQELSTRHGTREDEVDAILRNGLLVDLYRVVRQSIVIGQPGYSIKDLEIYFGKRTDQAIKTAEESVIHFEQWLAARSDPQARNDAVLADIEAYNRFDCESTYRLREWLLELRNRLSRDRELIIPFFTGLQPEETTNPRVDVYDDLKERLAARIPPDFDPEERDSRFEDVRPLWMAFQMLEYHWREEKPVHWRFHDRCEVYQGYPPDLLDDSECLVHLEFVDSAPVGGRSQSVYERYRFPLQEFKLEAGECYAPHDKSAVGEILKVEENEDFGVLTLVRAPRHQKHQIIDAVVVRKVVQAGKVRDALARFAEALLDGSVQQRYPAPFDLLTRALPRRKSDNHTTLQPETPDETTIGDILADLDRSYLFIQGPPGSGKTYTGARLIVNLLKGGMRVGVSANTHKAIHNLLEEIESVAHDLGMSLTGVKQTRVDEQGTIYASRHGSIAPVKKFDEAAAATLFAGTAWAFCGSKMFAEQPLDYLIIDEAGQVALPHAIAMSTMASNVVLLGDPLQLGQVRHTSHPGGIGQSVLLHLLGEELRPVPPDRGILLTKSYRMNARICNFISEIMYEGRLTSAPRRELQRVMAKGIVSGQGLRFIEVEHENNRQRSDEEANVIAEEIGLLLDGTVTDYDGTTRPLESADIIVVTPYNAQVQCIKRTLRNCPGRSSEIEVGTVDKFQGRQAHVVFFSTAASTVEEAPRGVGFLFDRNRFNVAVSRARSIAAMVGSSKLLTARCSSVDQARALSAVLRFRECALSVHSLTPGTRASDTAD
jgi:predicted RecB family nuclease